MSGADISDLALNYGEARRIQLVRRRQVPSGLSCEYRDSETAPCYMGGIGDDACDSCKKREPKWQEWRTAKNIEREALKALQRALVRAQEGR